MSCRAVFFFLPLALGQQGVPEECHHVLPGRVGLWGVSLCFVSACLLLPHQFQNIQNVWRLNGGFVKPEGGQGQRVLCAPRHRNLFL